ncbi:hypothetical protein [Mycolicibacterium fortuitum]|uniref:hypothetical protein n=1 Tax=Mycolicibacterium fortuitum TaxID=1766 RepID=UPI00262BA884|nr:hypothetical protein [Mycolicibacterium fortuitum]
MTNDTQPWQARAACRDEDPELNYQREKHGVWAGFERTDKGRPKLPHGPMPRGGYRIGRNNP